MLLRAAPCSTNRNKARSSASWSHMYVHKHYHSYEAASKQLTKLSKPLSATSPSYCHLPFFNGGCRCWRINHATASRAYKAR